MPDHSETNGSVFIENPILAARRVRVFVPLSYDEWIRQTSLAGYLYGTRSRGSSLQAIDRAYLEWIPDTSNLRAADALRRHLEFYLRNFAGPTKETHLKRDENEVISRTLAFIRELMRGPDSATYGGHIVALIVAQEDRLRTARRQTLLLVANMSMNVNKGALISGMLGLCTGVKELLNETGSLAGLNEAVQDPRFRRDFVHGFAIGAGAVSGAAVVGVGAMATYQNRQAIASSVSSGVSTATQALSNIRLPALEPTFEAIHSAASAVREMTFADFTEYARTVTIDAGNATSATAVAVAGRVQSAASTVGDVIASGARLLWGIIKAAFDKFKTWLHDVIGRMFGGDLSDIIDVVGKVLKITFKFVCKSAAPFVGGAVDIAAGLDQAIRTALIQLKLATDRTILVTSEATFAAIRSAIEKGVERRQALANWMVIKGTISVAVAASSAGMGTAIAEMVTGAFDYAMKTIIKVCEHLRMKSVRTEAAMLASYLERNFRTSTMASRVSGSGPSAEPETPESLPAKAFSAGYMPDFRAASFVHLSGEQFYSNHRGCFSVFLNAACKASPALAAAILNSGIFSDEAASVFHAVTPRTEGDEAVAVANIKRLKIEGKKVYEDSGFSLTPALVSSFPEDIRDRMRELIRTATIQTVSA